MIAAFIVTCNIEAATLRCTHRFCSCIDLPALCGQAARAAHRICLRLRIMLRFLSCDFRRSAWGIAGAIGRPGGISPPATDPAISNHSQSAYAWDPSRMQRALAVCYGHNVNHCKIMISFAKR
jgi:hypothetical protein